MPIEYRRLRPDERGRRDKYSYRQVMSREGRRRIEDYKCDTGEVVSIRAFNGRTVKTLNMVQSRGMIEEPRQQYVRSEQDYFNYFRGPMFGLTYESLFRQRKDTTARTTESGLILVKAPLGGADLPDFSWKVWFDPEKGYVPVRCESYRHAERLRFSELLVEKVEQVADGVWVPAEILIKSFNCLPNTGHFQEPISEIRASVDLRRSKWNTTLRDDLFDLVFPSKTRVLDEIHDRTFVTPTLGNEDHR